MPENLNFNNETAPYVSLPDQPEFPEGGYETEGFDAGTDLDDAHLENTEVDDAPGDTFEDDREPPQDLASFMEYREDVHRLYQEDLAQLRDIFDAQEESVREQVDARVIEQFEALGYTPAGAEKIHVQIEELRASPHAAFQTPEFQELLDTIIARRAEATAANEHANMLARIEYSAVREQVSAGIKWESVIAKALSLQAYGSLIRIVRALTATDAELDDFRKTMRARDTLRSFHISTQQEGDILSEAEVAELPEELPVSPDAIEEIGRWYGNTQAAMQCLSAPRREAVMDAVGGGYVFRDMNRICDAAAYHKGDGTAVPPSLVRALESATTQLELRSDAADGAWIREFLETAPDVPEIRGHEAVKNVLGVGDVEAWAKMLISQNPKKLSHGLRVVVFHEQKKEITKGRQANGWLHTTKGTVNIFVGTSERPRTAADIGLTTTHEIGHFAHNFTVPLPMLRKWATVHKNRPVTYLDGERVIPIKEDFAYTAARYTQEPTLKLGPTRVKFFTDYYGENLRPQSP